MQHDAHQENDAHDPEKLAVLQLRLSYFAEEAGIGVNGLGAEKDLQISEDMAEHEANQDNARYRHHNFLSDYGLP